jgi:hypothetical protein
MTRMPLMNRAVPRRRSGVPMRRLAITALMVLGLALTGCDGGEPGQRQSGSAGPRPSSEPSYQEVPGGQVGEPSAGPTGTNRPGSAEPTDHQEPTGHDDQHLPYEPAPADVATVAKSYIDAKENAESWHRDKPDSWLADVKPLMTDQAHRELSGQYKDGGSTWVWDASHTSGLAVNAVVNGCSIPGESKGQAETVVRCDFTDQVVDKSGKPIPLTRVQPVWPYVGPATAVLVMTKSGNKWLVDDDVSDAAG